MKDYTITIKVTCPIQAQNIEQAEERAERIMETVKVDHKNARWLGEIEFDFEIEEE